MRPKSSPQDAFELFQSRLDQQLNPDHPLVKLARQIDWERFEAIFAPCYCPDLGAPGKAIRLMVGLHYLKHAFDESDESVVARWVENPYWQYFCGEAHMRHECPIDPSSMSRWRQRVGKDRLHELLKQTIKTAVKQKHLSRNELKQVNVDTTVQEKNITHPTDSKLLLRSIVKVSKAAKQRGIPLRQSYVRVGRQAAAKAGRYAHARQFKRMRRELRRMRTWVGRLIRDIQRKSPVMDDEMATLIERCERVRRQQPRDSNKLYSLHEPEVRCISKGKAHKRYEFGQKVAVATTNRGDWFVAAEVMEENPYDGHTLARTLERVESNTGVALSDAYVDKGYRGHDYEGDATIHLAGSRSKHLSASTRTRRRRRSAIEPKIGHAKHDNRMGRCYLKGLVGDAINALLAAAGANFRKLLRFLPCAWRSWLGRPTQLPRHLIDRLCTNATPPIRLSINPCH